MRVSSIDITETIIAAAVAAAALADEIIYGEEEEADFTTVQLSVAAVVFQSNYKKEEASRVALKDTGATNVLLLFWPRTTSYVRRLMLRCWFYPSPPIYRFP